MLITYTAEGPDLQIKGGLGHPDPVMEEGGGRGGLKKSFFSPSGLSLVNKNKGGGPPRPFPWIHH